MGNYFNQELYGRATDLPWALEIDREHRPASTTDLATYHPTFLYELLWNLGVAALVIWADRGFRLGHGRAFALYVAAYTVGRFWIEGLRVDPANDVLGLRLNEWTSLVVFLGAVIYIVLSGSAAPRAGRRPRSSRPPAPTGPARAHHRRGRDRVTSDSGTSTAPRVAPPTGPPPRSSGSATSTPT